MNRKNTKKLLSVILSLVMVLSYLPASSFAFAVDGEAGPAVEADSNAGNDTTVNTDTGADNDTTVNTDTGADNDTTTTGNSDQVTEGDKEDPPAVEEKEEKKDEQAEPKEEGKKVEANTEAKEPAKGSEDGDPEGGEGGESGGEGGSLATSDQILDFVGTEGGLNGFLSLVHHEDGSQITPDNPARPGEKVDFTVSISEVINGLQFDMGEMVLQIPAGIELPKTDITGTSTVYVTDVDTTRYTLHNTYVIGADGYIRYIWNKEETAMHHGEPINIYDLACEAENFHYSLGFELTVGTDADKIEFSDELSFPVDRSVSLTVTKKIQIDGVDTFTREQKEQMVFVVLDANGNTVKTFTRADMEEDQIHPLENALYEITGLTSDTYPAEFTVKETTSTEIDGYTLLSSSQTQKTITIQAGDSGTADLTNIYSQDRGSLKVTKSFPGESELDIGGMNNTQKQKIKFTVYKVTEAGETPVATTDLTNTAFLHGGWELNDLEPGSYKVVETAELDGYTRTTTYTVSTDGGAATSGNDTTAPLTIEKDKETDVDFSNTYKKQKGNLKLKKTFAGAIANLSDADKRKIKFTITGPDENEIVKYYSDFDPATGELLLKDVLAGNYKVVESNATASNYTVTTTYSINNGGTVNGTTASSVPVPLNGTGEVAFTNTYTELGSIQIKKEIGGNYWTTTNYTTKRNKIGAGVTYNIYKLDGDGNRITPAYETVKLSSFNTSSHSYTFNNIPAGNYEIEEVVSGVGNIDYTVRTTTVKVGSGTEQSSQEADFSVTKGTTTNVTYTNNYDKKKGKIKLEKAVTIDGQTKNPEDLTEAQQKAITFTITGKDISGASVSKTVTLYDILYHQGEVGLDGYIEVPYSNSNNYTVKETGANIGSYIRVTTAELDGQASSSTNVSVKIGDSPNQSHTVTYTNNYTSSGVLKIDKTITGVLSASEIQDVKNQIYFTIYDKSNPARPIVKDANGTYKLGESTDTPEHFTLAQMTQGVSIPAGTYVVTEYDAPYNTDYYTCHTWNMQTIGGPITEGGVSADTVVTVGNEKLVYYFNEYSRVGVGDGVRVIKYVLLDGVEIGALSPDELKQFEADVKAQIKFEFYEGSSATGTPYATYNYQQLQDNPPMLYVGTWTVKEILYDVPNHNHSIRFTVTGATESPIVSETDTVTFTLAKNSRVSIDVKNAYTQTGTLIVQKLFGANSELKAEDLTDAQKQLIKFKVTGYSSVDFNPDDMSNNTVIWPPEGEPRPATFTYADMTEDENGIMTKKFTKVPTGIYVVEEEGAIANYTLVPSYDPDGDGVLVPFGGEATQKVTNTYTRKKGSLRIHKTFEGPLRKTEDKNQVTFTVKNGSNTPTFSGTYTYEDMNEEGYIVIPDLPTGEYIVKETNADYDFFERTTTVRVNTGEEAQYTDSGVNAPVEYDEITDVYITNTYRETGAMIINKTFDDSECPNDLTDEQKNAVKFTVKDASTGDVIKEITYAQILDWIQDHPGQNPTGFRFLILPGNYIVEESNADFDGYTRTTTATVNGTSATVSEDDSVSATVVKFDQTSVAFNNKYNEKGNLKVIKSVKGLDITDTQKQAIKFTLKQGTTVIKEFTFAEFEANGENLEYIITDLPAGNYTIEETVTDEGSAFYGYTRTTYVTVEGGDEYTNTVASFSVDSDGQTVTYRNEYSDDEKLKVVKGIGGETKGYIEKGEGEQKTRYPYWKFDLTITNLQPSTTDENGCTDLIDTYDLTNSELFEIVTSEEDLAAIAAADPTDTDVQDANKLISQEEGKTAPSVTLDPNYEDGKVTFKISGVTKDTAKSNRLVYYLIPKNEEALKKLNTKENPPVVAPNMVRKTFKNSVKYKALPGYSTYTETNEVTYIYEKIVVEKTATNYNPTLHRFEDEDGNEVTYALYEFIVNPERLKLSTRGYIDVTDEFSHNQSVDIESIKIERYDPATGEYIDPELGDVTLNNIVGYSLKLQLRDETCFRVSYKALILYDASQLNQEVQLSNTVTVEGFNDGTLPVIVPTSEGGGSVYQIKLKKYQDGNVSNGLKGAEFKMYFSKSAAEADAANNYANAIATFETDENGVILIREFEYGGGTHHIAPGIQYAFVETKAPVGYKELDYIVLVTLAGVGETANHDEFIYLAAESVNVRNKPFDTAVALGAFKKLKDNGSSRRLKENEFTFQIKAKDDAIIPMPEETEASNDADGKVVFGAVKYDTEDVITRDPDTKKVTGTSKTFYYEVSEVIPEGVTGGNKDGLYYDTQTHEVAVTVELVDTDNDTVLDTLKVTSVKVDGEEVNPDKDKYTITDTSTDPVTVTELDLYSTSIDFENEYKAQGTWKPVIQKDLTGRPLEEGEFTFQIKDEEGTVVAEGQNDANGNVTMDPETLTFTLADLAGREFTVHEVYDAETNNGMVSVAQDETVNVTVEEQKGSDGKVIYNGKLNVTADKATLTAPLVMENEYKATGSWHPKAEKEMDGVLKINEGDYSFLLTAVGNAPMPEGSTDGKLELPCEADGTVDFGQIDFRQGIFDNVKYEDGDKEFHYTIQEVIPEPEDRIFGVEYDDTVYDITVTTKINKTDKLGVKVECKPKTGWVVDESTATFTGTFTNTYDVEPAEATPEYEKDITVAAPSKKVIFKFELEEAEDNTGDFDYVEVNGAAFEPQEKELILEPGTLNGSGKFDTITFLAEGTYKFKITETPETNEDLDEHIEYDTREYTYTVVVKGSGKELNATGTYSYMEDDEEQSAEIAKFTNKYTTEPVVEILRGVKVIDGEPQKDEEFTFKLESDGNNAQLPDGSHIPNPMPEEDEVTIYGEGEFEFGDITYEWPGEYYYKISEAAGDAMGFEYDTAIWSVKVTVTDIGGYLEAETTYVSDADEETLEELATFTNPYTTSDLKITKTVEGEAADKNKKFKFTIRLFDKDGDPLEGVYLISGDAEGKIKNGVGTVKLAHGEEAYVTEIPIDATWIVEEEDYDNYTAKCDKDHGTITVDKASESNWINTTGVDTGDHNTVGGYLGLFGTSLMALIAMIFGRRRRRENEK